MRRTWEQVGKITYGVCPTCNGTLSKLPAKTFPYAQPVDLGIFRCLDCSSSWELPVNKYGVEDYGKRRGLET